MEWSLASLVVLPIGLGLLGFVEPCSLGSTLIFIKTMEGSDAQEKLTQVGVFALSRALFTGLLGLAAVIVGSAFLGFQRSAWVALGLLYVALGVLFIANRAWILNVALGPSLARLTGVRGSAMLGVLFGLNIPACAAPLIFAVLAAAAAGGASGATLLTGFVSLALFGLALSLPLTLAVLFEGARRAIDWLGSLSRRLPVWTGVLLMALGLWSIWFGVFARIEV